MSDSMKGSQSVWLQCNRLQRSVNLREMLNDTGDLYNMLLYRECSHSHQSRW